MTKHSTVDERVIRENRDLRRSNAELRIALRAGWTWGQYLWAKAHPDDVQHHQPL